MRLKASELSSTGGAQFPHTYWRDARGWFEYAVAVGTDDPVSLRCVWWGSDAGRTFDILVDGRELTTVRLTGEAPGEYVVKSYDVPREWTQGKDRVRIRFRAHEGSVAGGLFELRVVRPPG